jgi:rRNA-processing protein EBP2
MAITYNQASKISEERSNALPTAENEAELFDIALDNETKREKTDKSAGGKGKSGPNFKRQKKNDKYGFGGKKRHAKSGDTFSSADMRDFSVKKMKGKVTGAKQRFGKDRRAKGRL